MSDDIAIDIYSDNIFNEGHEVAELEFTNSENRPEFLFGMNRITQIIIIDRSECIKIYVGVYYDLMYVRMSYCRECIILIVFI